MRFAGRGYRGHDPGWSFSPLSGEGAAKTGGRFNRRGQRALYLALDAITAVGECTQGFTLRMLPLLLCEYDVDIDPVADLRDGPGRRTHRVALADLGCGWLTHLRAGTVAPSWKVADRLHRKGFAGILAPAFFPGATAANCNLILWRWGPDLPAKVSAYDPTGRLPKDQLSWR